MRYIVASLAFLLFSGVLPVTPRSAHAQTLTLYDDFSSAAIDGDRWIGYQYVTRPATGTELAGGWANDPADEATVDPATSVVNAAAVRQILSGRARLALTTHGAREQADLAQGTGRMGLRTLRTDGSIGWFEEPPTLTGMQAQVTVTAASAEPCGGQASRTRAQVLAHFFADGEPGDNANRPDVFASLSLERHSALGDRIIGVVSRCRWREFHFGCEVADDVGFVVFTRRWTLGRSHTLRITHDAAQRRFVFRVSGGGLDTETRSVAYPAPVSPSKPFRPARDVLVENAPAACASAGNVPRPTVRVDARFDNMRLNAEAFSP